MTLRMSKIGRNIVRYTLDSVSPFSTTIPKVKNKKGELVISCKRNELNHYSSVHYGNLDEVPLASKGWNHSKAKGDFFTVLPSQNQPEENMYSFNDMGIHKNIIDVMKKEGIDKATEFQYRAVEGVRSGDHVMLAAETGCGKTLSYLLPIIHDLLENKATAPNTPKAVIIVPNRELAYQVGEVARNLSDSVGLISKIVIGGRTKSLMMNPVFEDIDILVATPGSLGKLSTVGIYKLNEAKYTVLDEADTLMDDSFVERISSLIRRLSQSQMILVTATLPRTFPEILVSYENSLRHVVSSKIHKPLLNITQKFLRLTLSSRAANLLQMAKKNKDPMIVFSNRNQTCNWAALFLNENGVSCANINGDMHQALRIEQWNKFVSGQAQILSATDVGSRGLNTIQVKHVINYDFPLYAADYLHRIGRVGRLGSHSSCKVTNFIVGQEEIKLVQQIELAIRRNQPLENVDGNITKIVQRKIARKMSQSI
nr:probable ATP-dependent RNA helicase DDX28 isoform X1 [Leptinotarsa decemlineata]